VFTPFFSGPLSRHCRENVSGGIRIRSDQGSDPPYPDTPSTPPPFHPHPAPFQPPRSRARKPASTGNDVHALREYGFNRAFRETARFKGHFNLHNSGLLAGPKMGSGDWSSGARIGCCKLIMGHFPKKRYMRFFGEPGQVTRQNSEREAVRRRRTAGRGPSPRWQKGRRAPFRAPSSPKSRQPTLPLFRIARNYQTRLMVPGG